MLHLIALALTLEDRLVKFSYVPDSSVEKVSVVGQFNNWDKTRNPLALSSDRRTWKASVSIAPGVYQYLFVENGNRWVPDPHAPKRPDGNGNINSLLVVLPKEFGNAPAKHGDGKITAAALKHRPGREDSVRLDETSAALWLRTRKGDAEAAEIVSSGDRSPMRINRSDELYDYWRGTVPIKAGNRYTFAVLDGSKELRYPTTGAFSQDLGAYPLPAPPTWVQDAVFYQIFPDRFRNGDPGNDGPDAQPWGTAPTATNWMGGDLVGIRQGMDHLAELGVSALYLNPTFPSSSNHGYNIFDYESVNPRFGTKEDMKALVADAHHRGWRVILDGVFNHSGTEFPPFQDLLRKGADSKYKDWYMVTRFPIEVREGQQTYRTFAGVTSMPKLNSDSPAVRGFVKGVATKWINEVGIDGWRLDVADEVSHGLWREFRSAVKGAKPDAYILGEVWGDAHEYLQGDEHDGVMNYRWRKAVLDLFAYRRLQATSFDRELGSIREDYPAAATTSMFNLLGSHDTERVATIFKGNRHAQMAATIFQFTYPGTPSIYYGDEIGLEGGRDPDDRRCMPWDRAKWDLELFELYKDLITLRKLSPALRRGSFQTRLADDKSGVFDYERRLGDERIEVVLNTQPKPAIFLRGLSKNSYTILLSRNASASDASIELGPYGALVMRRN